jgi:two-component system sensor histidine kinase PfeS
MPNINLPPRRSLFWRLAGLLVAFCLLMIWLSWSWGRYVETQNAFLSHDARSTMAGYAEQAERAWVRGGRHGVDTWLNEVSRREGGWVGVVGPDLQSLSSTALTFAEVQHLTFLRGIDWPVSRHNITPPWLKVAFPEDPRRGTLVIQLPERYMPGGYTTLWRVLINGVIPAALTLLLCAGLYRMLVVPLNQLREQAKAWRADQLNTRLPRQMAHRQDELGELARAFDQMSERLQSTVEVQQQLLRDLSHELRTPLSRLRVACETERELEAMRQRLSREVDGMQRLVEDTLQLAWLDTERAPMPREPIQVQALWEMIAENACFESGWPMAQLQCKVDAHCWVEGHLNSLAQALENILRNAIRHSPPNGLVSLGGRLHNGQWHLWLEDQGGGVAEADLERIFAPFTRLDGSRPGDGGFGLGLSIARNALLRQSGVLWAQNGQRGLCLHLRLPVAYNIPA